MSQSVSKGPSTYTALALTGTGVSGAIVAFVMGDRSEQTMGVIAGGVVALVSFVVMTISRTVQAKAKANQTTYATTINNTAGELKSFRIQEPRGSDMEGEPVETVPGSPDVPADPPDAAEVPAAERRDIHEAPGA